MEKCPICDESVWDIESHVWQDHVLQFSCWCGFNVTQVSRAISENVHVFSEHCRLRGGFLSHYLECQLGGEDASHVPNL
jgi:hypothetical protein